MRELIGDYESFILNISHGLPALGIERAEIAMMDHICYRVETIDRYLELKTKFIEKAIFLNEAVVSGRQISTFEFEEYLTVEGWTVPYLELPEPKEGSPYPEGLEHAELVVIGGLERFAERHQDLQFDRKAMGKTLNPELGLKTDSLSIKFHEGALGSIVRIEERLGQG